MESIPWQYRPVEWFWVVIGIMAMITALVLLNESRNQKVLRDLKKKGYSLEESREIVDRIRWDGWGIAKTFPDKRKLAVKAEELEKRERAIEERERAIAAQKTREESGG